MIRNGDDQSHGASCSAESRDGEKQRLERNELGNTAELDMGNQGNWEPPCQPVGALLGLPTARVPVLDGLKRGQKCQRCPHSQCDCLAPERCRGPRRAEGQRCIAIRSLSRLIIAGTVRKMVPYPGPGRVHIGMILPLHAAAKVPPFRLMAHVP